MSPHDIGNHYVLRKLIKHAFSNAVRRASNGFDYCYRFYVDGIFLCSLDLLDKTFSLEELGPSRKISHTIEIDRELLLCLLLGLEHWDNAEKEVCTAVSEFLIYSIDRRSLSFIF